MQMQRLREGARRVYDTTKRAADRAGQWCVRHPYATMGAIFASSLLIKGTVDHAGDISNYFHNLINPPSQHIDGKVLYNNLENRSSSGTDYYNNLDVCTDKGVSSFSVHTGASDDAGRLRETLKPGDYVRADLVGEEAVDIREDPSLAGMDLDNAACNAFVKETEARADIGLIGLKLFFATPLAWGSFLSAVYFLERRKSQKK